VRRILLVATIATILSGALCAAFTPPHAGPLPRGFRHPVFAAELVRDAAEIAQVYGTSAPRGACADASSEAHPPDCASVRVLRLNTCADFLFIACYASMLFFLGRSMGGRLGAAISLLAPLAALADVFENIGILRATVEPASDSLAWTIRTPSLIKWSLLGLVWTALFRRFVRLEAWRAGMSAWRFAELAVGTFYALGGLTALVAVLDGNAAVETSAALLAPAFLGQLIILWRDRGFVARLGVSSG
jgi:hypothetical protein